MSLKFRDPQWIIDNTESPKKTGFPDCVQCKGYGKVDVVVYGNRCSKADCPACEKRRDEIKYEIYREKVKYFKENAKSNRSLVCPTCHGSGKIWREHRYGDDEELPCHTCNITISIYDT